MKDFITVSDLTFSYSEEINENVLENIYMNIRQGEFIAVLGHNGCGKSTLAKHFNAILLPSSGTVYVDGINTADEEKAFDIRQKIGMVFQNPDNQIVATVVEEDVAFGLENIGVLPSQIRERVDSALKAVNMYEYRLHSPHQLSGGQKQRVAIAGIIAMRPKCIVLDEPTAMLDPQGRKEVIKTIRQLNKDFGITVVLITHYMDEAVLADNVYVMEKGKILIKGTPKEVFSHVELIKSVGLDVPQVTDLCYQLKKQGIDIQGDVITENECIEAISRLLEE